MHYQTTDEALRNRIRAAAQTKGLDTAKLASRYTAERCVDHWADAMGAAPTQLVGGLQFPQDVRPTADADIRSVVRYSDDELLRGCQRLKEIFRPQGVHLVDVRIRELRVGLPEPVKRLQVFAQVGGMRGNTTVDVASGFWGRDAWAADWTADVVHESFFKGGPTYTASVQSLEASCAEKWIAIATQMPTDLRMKHHADLVFFHNQDLDLTKLGEEINRILRFRGVAHQVFGNGIHCALQRVEVLKRASEWEKVRAERPNMSGFAVDQILGSIASTYRNGVYAAFVRARDKAQLLEVRGRREERRFQAAAPVAVHEGSNVVSFRR